MNAIIKIKHPFPFRVTERDAAAKAIQQVTGIRVVAWYTAWEGDMPTDRIETLSLTASARRKLVEIVLVLMRAAINEHHDSRSFETPEVISE